MPKKLELTPPVAILLCGVLIAGAIVYVNRFPASAAPAAAEQGGYATVNVPAPAESDHVYGSRTASVFLIEYSDLQCIYCARAYPTLKSIVDSSQGTVALIHRHLPLQSIHPEAHNAAVASECVAEQLGESGFWAFVDQMFENSGANQAGMSPQFFASAAGRLGINPVAYNACVAQGSYDALIERQAGEALAAGAQGTPYTVVYSSGGQVGVSGAVPAEQFRAVIQAVGARQ